MNFSCISAGRRAILSLNSLLMVSSRFFLPGLSSKQKKYSEQRLVGYTQEQMFDIVANVAEYPQFVPWCREVNVQVHSKNLFFADIGIGFPPVQVTYRSKITTVKPRIVKSICVDNALFHNLDTIWRFEKGVANNHNSCIQFFTLVFEFRSALYSNLAHIFFDQVVCTMVIAFLKRAEAKYGPPSLDHFKTGTVLSKIN